MTSPPIKHTHRKSLFREVDGILRVTDPILDAAMSKACREVSAKGVTPEESLALLRSLASWCEHHISRVELKVRCSGNSEGDEHKALRAEWVQREGKAKKCGRCEACDCVEACLRREVQQTTAAPPSTETHEPWRGEPIRPSNHTEKDINE